MNESFNWIWLFLIILLALSALFLFIRKKKNTYIKTRLSNTALSLLDISSKSNKLNDFEEFKERLTNIHSRLEAIQHSKYIKVLNKLDVIDQDIIKLKAELKANKDSLL